MRPQRDGITGNEEYDDTIPQNPAGDLPQIAPILLNHS